MIQVVQVQPKECPFCWYEAMKQGRNPESVPLSDNCAWHEAKELENV